MGPTTELRRALKETFFAHATRSGFIVDARRQPQSTTFRRQSGDRVHIFEVQWEKYGRPRFAVHFGTCPAAGLQVEGATLAPEETLATWCTDRGSLRPRRSAPAHAAFRQDATLWQRVLGRPRLRNAAAVVDEVMAVFPELERYWTHGDVGPHLKLWQDR
jgi:hypothetical protein